MFFLSFLKLLSHQCIYRFHRSFIHSMHIQPTSEKTPMNDLDNPVLLLGSHLVVTRKT